MDTFFQQDGTGPYTENVFLDVLHDVFGSHVLSNLYPELFGCGWSWPPCSPDINIYDYYIWGYIRDRLYRTNPHTVQGLQDESEAVDEGVTGDTLLDTVDNFVARLLQAHKV
jgi:hypothetical protein